MTDKVKFTMPLMDQVIIDECDFGHKFAKLPDHPMRDNIPRCPYCMAIGLDKARKENKLTVKWD